jgi:hypothetical protein
MTMREGERRKLNILEALIIASLIGLGTMIMSMRDSIIEMRVSQESTNKMLATFQLQMAGVPALADRVSRVEVRTENLEEGQKELRANKGLR